MPKGQYERKPKQENVVDQESNLTSPDTIITDSTRAVFQAMPEDEATEDSAYAYVQVQEPPASWGVPSQVARYQKLGYTVHEKLSEDTWLMKISKERRDAMEREVWAKDEAMRTAQAYKPDLKAKSTATISKVERTAAEMIEKYRENEEAPDLDF